MSEPDIFLTAPRVYEVGYSSKDYGEIFDFHIDEFDTDEYAEGGGESIYEPILTHAARLCYMSFKSPRPGGPEALIRHLLEVGHGSVLEHVSSSFIITGVSRSLTHELVRHRAGFAFSQLSQRYVDESDCKFVVPPEILGNPQILAVWKEKLKTTHNQYVHLVNLLLQETFGQEGTTERRKRARQAARSILPNCTETKIFVTANLRAWRHFLELRGSRAADKEIQRLAFVLCDRLKSSYPVVFEDFEVVNGELTCKYHKV